MKKTILFVLMATQSNFALAATTPTKVDNPAPVMQAMSDLKIGGYAGQPLATPGWTTTPDGKTTEELSLFYPLEHGGVVYLATTLKVYVSDQASYLVMTYVSGQTENIQTTQTVTTQLTASTPSQQIIADVVQKYGTVDTADYSSWSIPVKSYSISQLLCWESDGPGSQPSCNFSN